MNRAQLAQLDAAQDDERPSSDPHYEKVRLRHLDEVATRFAKAAGLRVRWNGGKGTPPPLRNQFTPRRAIVEEASKDNPFAPTKARLMAGR